MMTMMKLRYYFSERKSFDNGQGITELSEKTMQKNSSYNPLMSICFLSNI